MRKFRLRRFKYVQPDAKWKKWIEGKCQLPFSDLVNVVVLLVSLLALIVGVKSLKVSTDGLKSAERAGADQQKVLDASHDALAAVVDRLNIQTQLALKQYNTTLLKPKLQVYITTFGDKVQLYNLFETQKKLRLSSLPIKLQKQTDGRTFFAFLIENIGDRDLIQANVSVQCDVPFDTYDSLGETERSSPEPEDPHSGYWTINFTLPLLAHGKQVRDAEVYKFSTKGPYPAVFLPQNLFGCFVRILAPGLEPFVVGSQLIVIDK